MTKKYNHFEIPAPVSPCSFSSKKKMENVSMITVSAGGGMGGSIWQDYGEIINGSADNGGFITIKDAITNKERKINTRFIVEVEEVQVIKVVWNTTAWANYNKKVCNKQTQTFYYWFPTDAIIKVGKKYADDKHLENYRIKKIVEEK